MMETLVMREPFPASCQGRAEWTSPCGGFSLCNSAIVRHLKVPMSLGSRLIGEIASNG